MAHYYAFCQAHGKCGPNRQSKQQAWNDVDHHLDTVPGPHGQVFVKLSNWVRDPDTGRKKFSYKFIKAR